MRWCRLILVCCLGLLALTAPAWAANQTIFVKPDGNNTLNGLSWANAVQDVAGAMTKITGGGNTICLENGARILTLTATGQTATPAAAVGTASARNTITGCSNPDRPSTDKPMWTHAKIRTGWTRCTSTSVCSGLTAAQISANNIWKTSLSKNPHRAVLLDENLQNTNAHGMTGCTYAASNLSTYNLLPCWHPMLPAWGQNNGPGVAPSLGGLNLDKEFFWRDSTDELFMVSTSDPDTRFTNPGVTTLEIEPPACSPSTCPYMLRVTQPFWDIVGIHMHHGAFQILTTDRVSNIRVRDSILSFSDQPKFVGCSGVSPCPSREGNSLLFIDTNFPSDVVTNIEVTNTVIHDTSRDGIALSGPGAISNVTFTGVEIYNAPNHPCYNPNHAFCDPAICTTGISPGGTRTNIVWNRTLCHNACGAVSTGATQTAGRDQLTFTDFVSVFGYPSDTDPRLTDVSDCGITAINGFYGDDLGDITINRCLIFGQRRGIQHKRRTTNLNINRCTIFDNALSGIASEVCNQSAPGTITVTRSYIGDNGTGQFEIGCTVSGSNVTWAGGATTNDENFLRRGDNSTTGAIGFNNGQPLNLTNWINSPNVTGWDASQVLASDPLPGKASGNYMPASSSPLFGSSTTTPRCGATAEAGMLEAPEITAVRTLDANTWEATVCSLWTPIQVASACTGLTPRNGGQACTPSNCTVTSPTTFTFDVGGTNCQGLGASSQLTLALAANAIQSADIVPGLRAYSYAHAGMTVNNTLQSTAPLPTGCSISNTARDDITVTFNPNAAGNMTPATAAEGFSRCTDAQCTSPVTQDSAVRSGTAAFVVDFPTDATPGNFWIRYDATTGNVANASAVEPTSFIFGPCSNDITNPSDTWFVRTTGSDSNTCEQAKVVGTPKQTIAAGMACLTSGGTLDIGAGVYTEALNFNNVANGTVNDFTVIKGAGALATHGTALAASPPTTIIRPTTPVTGGGLGWRVNNFRHHIRFERLALDMSLLSPTTGENDGISVGQESNNLIFDSIEIANVTGTNEDAFSVRDSNSGCIILRNSWIHNIDDGDPTNPNHAVYNQAPFLGQQCPNQYRNNLLEDIRNNAINVRNGGGNHLEGIIATGNVIRNIPNGGCIAHDGAPVTGGLWANNTCANALTGMILLADSAGTRILHNTIFDTTGGGNTGACFRQGGPVAQLSTAQKSNVRNNICRLTTEDATWIPANNFTSDPLFVALGSASDFTDDNYRLQSGSGARNTATCQSDVTTDFDGVTRPIGAACDHGAFEFNTPDTAPPLIANVQPTGTRPAGTTSQLMSWTTTETANCRIATTNQDYDDMSAGSVTSTDSTAHSVTLTGLSDGQLVRRFIGCEDPSGNESAITQHDFTVSFPRPTVTACAIPADDPDAVVCDVNDGGNGPLQPAANCATAGWTCTKGPSGGQVPWQVDDCDIPSNRITLDMATNAVFQDVAFCTYNEAAGNILNAGGTLELVGGTPITVGNNVAAPAPVAESCVVQDAARDSIIVTFNPGAGTTLNPATDTTALTSTINGSTWTQAAGCCDRIGNIQYRITNTTQADHDDIIRVIVTQGTASTITNTGGTEVQAKPGPEGLLCLNNIAPPAPNPVTLQSAILPDTARDRVRFFIDTGGSSPVLPASNAAGLSCTINGQPWTKVGLANRPATSDFFVQIFTPAATSASDEVRCSYDQATGNITNNAATVELTAFTNTLVTNEIEEPVPQPEISSCAVTDADGPDKIRVFIDSKNLSPLTPALDASGFSAQRVQSVSWAVEPGGANLVTGEDIYLLDMDGVASANQRIDLTYTPGGTNPVLNSGGAELVGITKQCSNTLTPPPPPLFSTAFVRNDAPTKVFVVINSPASPILPATGCVGFSLEKNPGDPWTVSSCTRPSAEDIMELTMSTALLHTDVPTISYTQQGGAVAGRVRSNDGIELAAFTGRPVTNQVLPPVAIGILAQTDFQCFKAEQTPAAAGALNQAAPRNTVCPVRELGRVQIRQRLTCSTNSCQANAFRPYACDGSCDQEANWYALTGEFQEGKLARLGPDSRVTSLGTTTQVFDACTTFVSGTTRKDISSVFIPRIMPAGGCTEDVDVIEIAGTAVAGNQIRVCLRRTDGTTLADCSPSDLDKAVTLQVVGASGSR